MPNYLEVFSDVVWVFMDFHELTQIVHPVVAIHPRLSSCPDGVSQAPGSFYVANSPTSALVFSFDLQTPEVASYCSGPTMSLCCLASELCSLFFFLPSSLCENYENLAVLVSYETPHRSLSLPEPRRLDLVVRK